jgi:hypothetical protein
MPEAKTKRIWLFVAVLATGFSKDAVEGYSEFAGKEFNRAVAFYGRALIAILLFLGTASVALFGSQWWTRVGGSSQAPAEPSSRASQVETKPTTPRPSSTPVQGNLPAAVQPKTEPIPPPVGNTAAARGQDAGQGREATSTLPRSAMISAMDGVSLKEGVSADLDVASPPALRRVRNGTASYDSVYKGSPPGYPYSGFNPFEGGLWSNSGPGSAWAAYEFNHAERVSYIFIRLAGTDVTARGSVIEVAVRAAPDGDWIPVFNMREKVINRDFSGGKSGPRTGPIMIALGKQAIWGVKVSMWGHGWFGLGDVQILASEM